MTIETTAEQVTGPELSALKAARLALVSAQGEQAHAQRAHDRARHLKAQAEAAAREMAAAYLARVEQYKAEVTAWLATGKGAEPIAPTMPSDTEATARLQAADSALRQLNARLQERIAATEAARAAVEKAAIAVLAQEVTARLERLQHRELECETERLALAGLVALHPGAVSEETAQSISLRRAWYARPPTPWEEQVLSGKLAFATWRTDGAYPPEVMRERSAVSKEFDQARERIGPYTVPKSELQAASAGWRERLEALVAGEQP